MIRGFVSFIQKILNGKRQNECFNYFADLIYFNNKKNYDILELFDVVITGNENDNNAYKFIYGEFVVKNGIYLYNCKFVDDLYLIEGRFLDDLILVNCDLKSVTFDKCRFKGDRTAIIESEFKESFLIIEDTCFKSDVSITSNIFSSNFEISFSEFENEFEFLFNTFKDNNCEIYLYGNFLGGLSYQSNIHTGSLLVNSCHFGSNSKINSESLFFDIHRDANFEFSNNIIVKSVTFKGRENELMFGSNSKINLYEKEFNDNSQIIFENCDLQILNQNLREKLSDLKNSGKVKLVNSQLYNFYYVLEYPTREIEKYIIEDYVTVIKRFFNYLYSDFLETSFQRSIDHKRLKIIFRSHNILEETFIEKIANLPNKLQEIKHDETEIIDYFNQIDSVFYRMLELLKRGIISDEWIKTVSKLTDTKNNICLMPSINIHMKDSNLQIGIGKNIDQKLISNSHNENNKKEIFEKAKTAKADLEKSGRYSTEEIKDISNLIDSILNQYNEDGEVPNFYKASLLSLAGNISSIASFIQSIF